MSVDSITIAGKEFEVPNRYIEGHVLTAGEAQALNQTFHENIRNNMAKKVKEGADQDAVSAYALEYQFGVRQPGTGRVVGDPVLREAINLAKAAIKAALKAQNKEAPNEAIATLAESLAKDESRPFMQKAREIVEQRKAASEGALAGILDALGQGGSTQAEAA